LDRYAQYTLINEDTQLPVEYDVVFTVTNKDTNEKVELATLNNAYNKDNSRIE